jgi:small conductance mechanosensitive channel
MVFGIGYGDDIDKAKNVIKSVIENDARIFKNPEPQIVVSELADSSVNFNVRPWVNSADYWGVYFDLTEQIKKNFDEQNISIPFPQRDIHMFQNQ